MVLVKYIILIFNLLKTFILFLILDELYVKD